MLARVLRYAVMLVLLCQLSGAAHLAAELAGIDGDHCFSDCGDEDCLPFCSTCSCSHAGRPFVAPRMIAAVEHLVAVPLPAAPSTTAPLIEPHVIFHPPKA